MSTAGLPTPGDQRDSIAGRLRPSGELAGLNMMQDNGRAMPGALLGARLPPVLGNGAFATILPRFPYAADPRDWALLSVYDAITS